MTERDAIQISPSMLAYLGDAVIEVMVRRRLICDESMTKQGHPSSRALEYVTAHAQSEALERIIPYLTEEETDVFKRGRNCVHSGVPKNATVGDYRRATGFECVFGYLNLLQKDDRIKELFDIAYPVKSDVGSACDNN